MHILCVQNELLNEYGIFCQSKTEARIKKKSTLYFSF